MPRYVCETCGTEFPDSKSPPSRCPTCEEERQYVGWNGQRWTTLAKMRSAGFRNIFKLHEPRLHHIITQPHFAIGQRAFLVQTKDGNLLWDCLTFIDDATVSRVKKLGGIDAIAISHPHYYSSMVEWSETFGVPIYINSRDRKWVVMHASNRIKFWKGDKLALFGGLSLVCLGGHFDGATVAHWPDGAAGKGVLLSGDTLQVVPDRRWVSFMYSYPNLIPLSASKVRRITDEVLRYKFERIYGAFDPRQVMEDGVEAVKRSAERYIKHIEEE
jgi:glyoxylase-like metal-dependent hydrolase (beta-lactamase superfamily II)